MSKQKTENPEDQDTELPEPKGIFLIKGMVVDISEFSITITDEGKLESTGPTLKVLVDVLHHWLEIAFQHLLSTEEASRCALQARREGDDGERLAQAMESEFISGMQAIVASATALDAFYAAVKDRVEIPESLTETWRKNRTSRPKQIAEILFLAFQINDKNDKEKIQGALKEIYRFRDVAVHPKSQTEHAVRHPALNISTEWRFAYFRFENAKGILSVALKIVAGSVGIPRGKFERLEKYCYGLRERLVPIIEKWEEAYGELLPRS